MCVCFQILSTIVVVVWLIYFLTTLIISPCSFSNHFPPLPIKTDNFFSSSFLSLPPLSFFFTYIYIHSPLMTTDFPTYREKPFNKKNYNETSRTQSSSSTSKHKPDIDPYLVYLSFLFSSSYSQFLYIANSKKKKKKNHFFYFF